MVLQLLRVKGNSVHVLLTEMKGPEKKQPLPAKTEITMLEPQPKKNVKSPGL